MSNKTTSIVIKAIVAIIIVIVPIVIILIFWYSYSFRIAINPDDVIVPSDWMGFWGAIIGYIGTVSLGIVAVYQSAKANDAAEKANLFSSKLML